MANLDNNPGGSPVPAGQNAAGVPAADPAPQSVPDVPKEPRFVSDARFLANLKSPESLPDTTPTQTSPPPTPAPDQLPAQSEPGTATDPIAQPPAVTTTDPAAAPASVAPDDPLDFSADLPTGLSQPSDPADPAAVDPTAAPAPPTQSPIPAGLEDLKPQEGAPSWQLEAFSRIAGDQTLTHDEKRDILSQTPYSWSKYKQWQKAAKLVGKFRDPDVSFDTVFTELAEVSRERAEQFELASVNRVVSNGEQLLRFAETHPDTYSKLMVALADSAPDVLSSILSKHGYQVAKAEPVDASQLFEQFKQNPYYEAIEGTDLETELFEQFKQLAEAAQATPKPDDPPAPSNDAASSAGMQEAVAAAQKALETVQQNVWARSVSEGLASQGIRPASEAEIAANPLALMKTILHTVGQYGLPGVVADWDKQIDEFGRQFPDYEASVNDLERLLLSGQLDRFEETSSSLAPVYYRFGEQRARIPLIKNLYRMVEQMLATGQTPTVSAQTVQDPPAKAPDSVQPNGNGQPRDFKFSADRVFFQKQGGGR